VKAWGRRHHRCLGPVRRSLAMRWAGCQVSFEPNRKRRAACRSLFSECAHGSQSCASHSRTDPFLCAAFSAYKRVITDVAIFPVRGRCRKCADAWRWNADTAVHITGGGGSARIGAPCAVPRGSMARASHSGSCQRGSGDQCSRQKFKLGHLISPFHMKATGVWAPLWKWSSDWRIKVTISSRRSTPREVGASYDHSPGSKSSRRIELCETKFNGARSLPAYIQSGGVQVRHIISMDQSACGEWRCERQADRAVVCRSCSRAGSMPSPARCVIGQQIVARRPGTTRHKHRARRCPWIWTRRSSSRPLGRSTNSISQSRALWRKKTT